MAKPVIDLHNPDLGAAELRAALALAPHPEGGWYRETWRDEPGAADRPGATSANPRGAASANPRGAASAIIFLLAADEQSAWHRVDAAEIWLWHAGAPLELRISEAAAQTTIRLGPVVAHGSEPDPDSFGFQAVVPAFAWQSARSTGAWSLVSCIVAPAFSFTGFELAPHGVLPHAPPDR